MFSSAFYALIKMALQSDKPINVINQTDAMFIFKPWRKNCSFPNNLAHCDCNLRLRQSKLTCLKSAENACNHADVFIRYCSMLQVQNVYKICLFKVTLLAAQNSIVVLAPFDKSSVCGQGLKKTFFLCH
jgi:hypothetical protein